MLFPFVVPVEAGDIVLNKSRTNRSRIWGLYDLEIQEWLDSNITGDYVIRPTNEIAFTDAADAVHFKLRWSK